MNDWQLDSVLVDSILNHGVGWIAFRPVELDWWQLVSVEEVLDLLLDALLSQLTSSGPVGDSVLQIGGILVIKLLFKGLSLLLLEQPVLLESLLEDLSVWCAHIVVLLDQSASFWKILVGSDLNK